MFRDVSADITSGDVASESKSNSSSINGAAGGTRIVRKGVRPVFIHAPGELCVACEWHGSRTSLLTTPSLAVTSD